MSTDIKLVDELEQLLNGGEGASNKFNQKCRQALPQIARVMKSNLKEIDVQTKCLGILKEYCYENEGNATELPNTDVFPMLFAALKHHHLHPTVVLQAFGLFVNLTVVEANRALLLQKGGVSYTIQIMEKLMENEEVQKMGLMVLRNMSCDTPTAQKEIALKGGVELLFHAANRHQRNPDIAEQFVATLLHISHTVEACKSIVEQGGIHLLLQLVSHAKEYPPLLVEEAGAVLVNLSLVLEAQDALVSEGCIPVMTKLLQAGKDNVRLTRRALQVLGNLACSDDLRELLLQEGCLGATVTLLQKPKTDVDVVRIGTWAMCNFVTGNKTAQEQLARILGGPTMILSLLNQHQADAEIFTQSCKLLWTLCYAFEEVQTEVGKKAVPLLLPALKSHNDSKELLQEVLSLLVNLTLSHKTHRDFFSSNGVQVLSDVIRLNRSNVPIVNRSYRSLINIADADEGHHSDVLSEKPLIASILKGLQGCSSDTETQMKGCKLLAVLSGNCPNVSEIIIARKGVELLVQNAKANWDVPNLLRYYLSVLLNVSVDNSTHKALLAAGVTDVAIKAMKEFPDSLDVQKRCLWLLGNLIGNGEELDDAEWPLIFGAMKKHIDDSELQVVGLWILDELSSEETRLEPLHKLGIIDTVLSALNKHPVHIQVHLQAYEVLLNFAVSRQRNLRALVPTSALDHVIATLPNLPPNVQQLGFHILGEVADVHQAHLLAQDAMSEIQQAMEANAAERQLQADGAAALCQVAAATNNWRALARNDVMEALIRLQGSESHPSVQWACGRAFQALAALPEGAHALLDNSEAVSTLIILAVGSNDVALQETSLLAMAQVVSHGTQGALQPYADVLGKLFASELSESGDARVLACLCAVTGHLVSKDIIPGSEADAARARSFLERCKSESNQCDYHDLRLMVGYLMCSLMVKNTEVRSSLLQSKEDTDTIWQTVQDLLKCPDVQSEFALSEEAVKICQKVADDLIAEHPLGSMAEQPIPQLADRDAHRKEVSLTQQKQKAVERSEFEKKTKQERREALGTAFRAVVIVEPTEEPSGPESSQSSQIGDHLRPPMCAKDEQRRLTLTQGMEAQLGRAPNPEHVIARLEFEDAEAWARYHVEMDALEARRRINVRMAQHRKALTERGMAMDTLLNSWYNRLAEENTSANACEDELKQGTHYLRAALERKPVTRTLPPRPPPPSDELMLGRTLPTSLPIEPTENVSRPSSRQPAATMLSPMNKRKQQGKLRNVVGWETLVSKAQKSPPHTMVDDNLGTGAWPYSSPVRRLTGSADHPSGSSSLPGYIYFQKSQEHFAVHPPGSEALHGTNFRSVAVPSTLPQGRD